MLRKEYHPSTLSRWPQMRLGDIGQIGSGITLGKLYLNEETRLVPYLRVANVKDGYLDLSDVSDIAVPKREIGNRSRS